MREFEVDTHVLCGIEVHIREADTVHIRNGVGVACLLAGDFSPEPVDRTADDTLVVLPVDTEVTHICLGPREEGLCCLCAAIAHNL